VNEEKYVDRLKEWIEETKVDKYARGGVETIDLIHSKLDLVSFALGNVLKYVSRYPTTMDEKDLLKAGHYLAMVWSIHHRYARCQVCKPPCTLIDEVNRGDRKVIPYRCPYNDRDGR